ncbi:MAG: vWA domain-containing protein [Candidatus Aminicenantes bacterium]
MKEIKFSLILGILFAVAFTFIFPVKNLKAEDNSKTIELILDASGSMNAQLSSGELKIAAAKKAVKELIQNLPDDMEIAFRAYGHQSPREEKDCEDTQLLVDFGKLETNREKIGSSLETLKAQGYTPITYVLNLAIKDFAVDKESQNTIILISDGKETCEGDPCVTAKELKEKGEVDLIVHTVGFGVDSATKQQLECISEVTGGQYFSASSTDELIKMLKKAVEAEVIEVEKEEGPGWLSIKGPELQGHKVIEAETGEEVGGISKIQDTIELPSGIYNVEIGNSAWKSVEVKPGETTVLEPGWLHMENATLNGHKVVESETGKEFGWVSRTDDTLTILPGTYDVMFEEIPWTVKIEKGKTTEVHPGVVKVKSASFSGHNVYDKSGKKITSLDATANWMPLPPGDYMIEIDGKKIEFSLKEGQEKVFKR